MAPKEIEQNGEITKQVLQTPNLIEHGYFNNLIPAYQLHYIANQITNTPRPVVVFVHGTPGSWSAFSRYFLEAKLNQHFRLIAIDRPGWGESGFAGEAFPTSLQEQAFHIAPLLQHIWQANHQQPLILVGHSLGGSLVPLLAANQPYLVKGSIILAGDLQPQLATPRWYNTLLTWLPDALLADKWQHSNQEVYQLTPSLMKAHDKLASLTSPVTILQGDQDSLVHPQNAVYAQQLFTQNKLKIVMLKEAGHLINLNQVDQVVAAIEEMAQ
ncbi:alpha/beta fold hydrolase [Marinomonas epiphytica]